MRPASTRSRALAPAAIALVLLSACAIVPVEPDTSARAPELQGFGELDWHISTGSPEAQRWFNAGVLQAYAFNEKEAIRMFKAALAQDPRCAMCAWGVAWQLGPNINDSSRDRVPEALRWIELAMRHRAGLTPPEQALLDALALRYGHGTQREAAQRARRESAPLLAMRCAPGTGADAPLPDALDLAYAERLGELQARNPQDPQLLSLWAEAEMVATRGDTWTGPGVLKTRPTGRIGEVATALEAALPAHPRHTGLNHYLIHAVDARGVAERASAAADRLGALAPASPHLVHMPSHTYGQTGRYAEAAQANEAALVAEAKLVDVQKAQGFDNSKDWRQHNQHYLWFAALMQGRGDAALQAARGLAERSRGKSPYGQYLRSLPLLTLLRLQRWDAVLAEAPAAATGNALQGLIEAQARGTALLRLGGTEHQAQAREQHVRAVTLNASLHEQEKALNEMLGPFAKAVLQMADVALGQLQAELASAEGRHADALRLQAQAVTLSTELDDSEPPMLAAGARLRLGELQLAAGQAAQAAATFSEDLARWPDSGWALAGWRRALNAQGRAKEAQALQPRIERAWAQADAGLKAAWR